CAMPPSDGSSPGAARSPRSRAAGRGPAPSASDRERAAPDASERPPTPSAAPAVSPLSGASVLAVSPTSAYRGCNTSIHRVRALEALGARVDVVDTSSDRLAAGARLRHRVHNRLFARGWGVPLPDPTRSAERARAAARRRAYDIIWLDKALTLGAAAL